MCVNRSFMPDISLKCIVDLECTEGREKTNPPTQTSVDCITIAVIRWRRHPDSNWRIKLLQSFALPLGYGAVWSGRRDSNSRHPPWQGGTLPLSYYRMWCLGAESNHRHVDFQSTALPTELPRQMATRKGLEPSTSSVTGWHSNRLNYRAIKDLVGTTGLEPVTLCL